MVGSRLVFFGLFPKLRSTAPHCAISIFLVYLNATEATLPVPPLTARVPVGLQVFLPGCTVAPGKSLCPVSTVEVFIASSQVIMPLVGTQALA